MDDETNGRPQLDAAQLQALLDAVDRLTSARSLDDVLGHILAIGQQLTASQAGSVILHDPKKDELYFAAATGPTAGEVKDLRIPVGKGKAGMVFARRLSIIENDLQDHFKAVDQKTHFATRSMVCVPLVCADKCYGVLQLLNKEVAGGAQPFDKIDLELTQRLAIQATIAIRNGFLFERMLASSGLHGRAEDRHDLVARFTGQNPTPVVELATILFVDMRGFTRFCRDLGNDPVRIQSYLNQFFGVLADAVLSNGGIVNKFLGDGLLAIFRGTDAPARAVQSAFAMHERFAPLRKGWQENEAEVVSADIGYLDIGVGIASDRITIGAVGDDKVSDFTIIGGAVNLAAALERMARGGKRILCDGPTFRAVKVLVSEVNGPELIKLGTSDFEFPDLRPARPGHRRQARQGFHLSCPSRPRPHQRADHSAPDQGRLRNIPGRELDCHRRGLGQGDREGDQGERLLPGRDIENRLEILTGERRGPFRLQPGKGQGPGLDHAGGAGARRRSGRNSLAASAAPIQGSHQQGRSCGLRGYAEQAWPRRRSGSAQRGAVEPVGVSGPDNRVASISGCPRPATRPTMWRRRSRRVGRTPPARRRRPRCSRSPARPRPPCPTARLRAGSRDPWS